MENTPNTQNTGNGNTESPRVNVEQQPQAFKAFATEEEFNAHSAGIRKGAEKSAQKQLLSQLGVESVDQLQEALKKAQPETNNKPAGTQTQEPNNELMEKINKLEESNKMLAEGLLRDKLTVQLDTLGVRPEARSYIVNDILSNQDSNTLAADTGKLKDFLATHPLGAIAVDSREPAIKKTKTRTIDVDTAKGINSFFAR